MKSVLTSVFFNVDAVTSEAGRLRSRTTEEDGLVRDGEVFRSAASFAGMSLFSFEKRGDGSWTIPGGVLTAAIDGAPGWTACSTPGWDLKYAKESTSPAAAAAGTAINSQRRMIFAGGHG